MVKYLTSKTLGFKFIITFLILIACSIISLSVKAQYVSDPYVCGGSNPLVSGQSITLCVNYNPNDGSGYLNGTNYDWQRFVSGAWQSTGVTSSNYTTSAAGTYRVVITQNYYSVYYYNCNCYYSWGTQYCNTCTGYTYYSRTVTSGQYQITNYAPPVTVNATVSISSSTATTFCDGGSVSLTSTGTNIKTGSYQWLLNGNPISGATNASYSANAAGSYSLRVTNDDNTPTISQAIIVTVYALPTPTITEGSATTFCSGGSVTLNASASSSYLWSNGATTQSINATTAGSYTVTVTNANGCSATSAASTVTVNALPTATITAGSTTSFCAGGNVTLNASSGVSYLWSNNATSASITATTTGNYTVTVTDGNGCFATSIATAVTVNPLPVVSGSTQPGQFGNGLDFDGTNDGVITTYAGHLDENNSVTTTWEAWVYPTTNDGNWRMIMGMEDGGWDRFVAVNGGSFQISHGGGSWSPVSADLNMWQHIAVVYDNANNTIKFYKNGTLYTRTGLSATNSSHYFGIGCSQQSSLNSPTQTFKGKIDEVRYWLGERTQAQIQANMNTELSGTETGLVAYYNFNQATAGGTNTGLNTLTDRTSNAKNGTLYNFALTGLTSNWTNGAQSTGGVSTLGKVCIGSSIQLSNATTGGVWTSSNTAVATVNNTGLVTGVSGGAAIISYTITNANNCSSTVTNNITVNQPSSSTTYTSICPTALPYHWNNLTFTAAGIQIAHLTNSVGCDSAATLNLTVNSPSASTTVIKVPFGATYLFNGVTYSATGIYTATLTNAVGCDSIATLNFTVDPKPSAGADQTVACGSAIKKVTLTGTLPTTGVWSSMAGNDTTATIGTNTNGVVEITLPVAPFTGKLSYVYTTFGGKDTVDIYVTGPTSPVINVNAGSPIICAGSTVQLCPLTWGFSNYQWYKDGYAVAGTTGTSSCITVDATGIGSYTLAGTNGSGCWSVPSAPQVVSTTNTLTKPTISTSGSTNLCNGGSVTLTSSSATGNLWFKNGNSTGAITPSITVTEPGDYSVLVSTGTCTSAMSVTTTVTGGVKASFITANATNNCDSTFSFTSTSANTTSRWNFGDGSAIVTGNSVTHKYATVALFTVQQAVISTGGCKDTAVQTVTIVSCPPPPAPTTCNITPGFTIINNTVNGGSYTYISTSTITNGNMTYFWDLGNGTTSTLISPTVTYATAGTYQVKLVVTGDLGCKDSITQSVVVTIAAPPVTPPACSAPVADFTIANATQCLIGNAFSFTNTSTGTAPTYTWTFGDGSAAVTTTAAAYSYTAANTYTVTLVATNSCGSNQVSKTVTVATAPAMPASISGAINITTGTTSTLSSATTGGVWNSSNTAVATVDANGVVTALAAGTATISYTISNSCGATATSLGITVTTAIPPSPTTCNITPGFNIINNTLNGGSYTYVSTSTITNGNMTYFWDLGNGTTSTLISPSVTYATAGTYQVKLVVTGDLGCKDSITQSVVVTITAPPVTPPACTAPVADFTIANATQCLTGNSFSFSNASTGTTPSYTWTFGDGSAAVTTTDATYSYTTANTYTVTLVATNACGSNQVSKTVTVNTAPAPPSGISGATTLTAGTTSNFSSATAGGVWGSSNMSVATLDANGIVTALAAGTANINYTVSNSCGSSTTSLSITVTAAVVVPPPVTPPVCVVPVANFTINNATQCLTGNSFSFNNTSTGTAPSYNWNFGDGSASVTTTAATHSYAMANTYTVTLVASNSCGSNQMTQTVNIGAQPKAGFSILTHTGNGQSTTFISSSTIAAGSMSYLWDLGNGQTSTLVNPTINYAPGTYTIKLVVSGIGSCKDSSIQSITELAVASVKVYPNPITDVIQVSFVSASATPTTFKLMDLAGRVLQIQTVTPSSRGVNVLATMSTRGLQSGSYVLYISDEQNGFLATKAILKQ